MVFVSIDCCLFPGCSIYVGTWEIPSDRKSCCCQNSHLMHLYQPKINGRMRPIENGQFWPGAELLLGHFAPWKLICTGRLRTNERALLYCGQRDSEGSSNGNIPFKVLGMTSLLSLNLFSLLYIRFEAA